MRKKFTIEIRSIPFPLQPKWRKRWKLWGRYETEKQRDDALKSLTESHGKYAEFRKGK